MAMQMDSADCRIGELMLTMKKMSTNMSISKDGTWEQMRKKIKFPPNLQNFSYTRTVFEV
jgi:hypothetical protein